MNLTEIKKILDDNLNKEVSYGRKRNIVFGMMQTVNLRTI